MKAGGLLTAVGVLIVLGGLVWWSNKHPAVDASAKTPAAPKLISVDAKQIEGIKLAKTGSDPIELARLAGSWTITKPMPMPADQDAVGMLTSTLSTLNADRLIDDHPASLTDFGLSNPPDEVDITLKGGKTTKLLIGSDTPAGTGTYAKLGDDPKVYTIPTFTKTSFDKTVDDLRDKRLLTFNSDKLTAVSVTAKGQTFEFGKNAQGDWQITKPKPLRADGLQVDDLVRKLKDAKMDLTATDSDAREAAAQFAAGEKVATVSTTDNTGTQTLEIHKGKGKGKDAGDSKNAVSYFAKSSVVAGIYKVAGDLGDSLGKGVEDYRNKKLFDFGFNEVSKLEINGAAYQKSGDKWAAGATQYEAGAVQAAIDKLRDLSASKFSDKMGGTQALTVAVTSGDNHRNEKVTFNKDGAVYDAQRDGEPAVYVIEAKDFDDLQKAIAGIKPQAAAPPAKK
ncbi:MAG TPA: DUF4340 domain-containing protein [Bryobacteraceae bacterium]|jgi:hypothetical protein|nr:DUF4340 domain-containing protein [Bryobacteraceae bacterium]